MISGEKQSLIRFVLKMDHLLHNVNGSLMLDIKRSLSYRDDEYINDI